MFIWHEYESAAASAQALAEAVAEQLRRALSDKGRAVLAVSGGRSPIAFFDDLSQKDLDWAGVGIALVDERIVPTDHADSNTALVREHLLKNKAAAAGWIDMVPADKSAEALQPEAVEAYALQQYRQPDVLVLGMGADGHTASLFPQAPQLSAAIDAGNAAPLIHTSPVTAPHERISMTLAAIADTPAVFLAIQGAEKKAVFEQAAAAASPAYPVGLILNHEGITCHVYYAE